MIAMLEVAQDATPSVKLTHADSSSPSGRNTLAFDRSETLPMTNLESP